MNEPENEKPVFNEEEFVIRAVNDAGCTEDEAGLYLLRKFEYLEARGLISENPEVPEEEEPVIVLSDDEQFLFFHKTTDIPADKITAMMQIEYTIMIEDGLICDWTIDEMRKEVCYTEEDAARLEDVYDYSLLMRKLAYIYENGIILEQDKDEAKVWYERGLREGWDENRPFVFQEFLPEPLRANKSHCDI